MKVDLSDYARQMLSNEIHKSCPIMDFMRSILPLSKYTRKISKSSILMKVGLSYKAREMLPNEIHKSCPIMDFKRSILL